MGIAAHSILIAEKQLCKGGCIKASGGQGKNVMVSDFGKRTLEGKSRQPVSCTVGNGEPLQAGTSDCKAFQQHHLPKLLSYSTPHSEAGKLEVWKCRQGTVTGQPRIRTGRESKVENSGISLGHPLESPILLSILERVRRSQRGSTRRSDQARGEPGQRKN